ncbi:GNAT family N-acetyltransferase [Apilactobacillus kunkeei]|uniref:GNAT family N-acetyltransferase n=1 Tax=Apilactobacillus kunkeei TaxID=148814 RepID=UPI0033420963
MRGTGKGKELLEKILNVINQYFPNTRIEIDAQAYVVGYYEKSGFKVTSEPFIEAGINHIKMQH